jgi:hypothetical protein
LHGEAALDEALGGQLRHRGAHPNHHHLRDVEPEENGPPVKTPSRKTNNQASFGGSLLKNNMEVEAMELQRNLDETGVHRVRTIYAWVFLGLHQVRPRFALRKKFTECKLFDFYVHLKFT